VKVRRVTGDTRPKHGERRRPDTEPLNGTGKGNTPPVLTNPWDKEIFGLLWSYFDILVRNCRFHEAPRINLVLIEIPERQMD
jgi:hypothetical protein